MIKLTRGECPKELSQEVIDTLTELYKNDKEKDVWNSSKIKEPLKEALMEMSHDKCVYCECILGVESKDVTIDHFKPKVDNKHIVVEWTNLHPSCLRCNRTKNRKIEKIIDPSIVNPKDHIGIQNDGRYRLKEFNNSTLGKHTISVLGLNDIERVMSPKLIVVENIIDKINDIYEDIVDEGLKDKHVKRLEKNLRVIDEKSAYSATLSSQVINSTVYNKIKELLIKDAKWNVRLDKMEEKMKELAFELI